MAAPLYRCAKDPTACPSSGGLVAMDVDRELGRCPVCGRPFTLRGVWHPKAGLYLAKWPTHRAPSVSATKPKPIKTRAKVALRKTRVAKVKRAKVSQRPALDPDLERTKRAILDEVARLKADAANFRKKAQFLRQQKQKLKDEYMWMGPKADPMKRMDIENKIKDFVRYAKQADAQAKKVKESWFGTAKGAA